MSLCKTPQVVIGSVPASPRRGFSLVEVMVVIAIIALILAIVLPALGGGSGAGLPGAMCRESGRAA